MYKTILLSFLSTLFIGCSSTNALKYFETDDIQARAVQHTKKADIINKNNEQKALIWATYLNNINHSDFKKKEETFLVSIYFVDNKESFEKSDYKLTLNDKEPISIIKIKKDDSKYNSILNNNPWAEKYLVRFERMKRVYDLNLKLSKGDTSSAQLKFEK